MSLPGRMLDKNLFDLPVDEIGDASVQRTFLAGEEVTGS